MNISVRRNAAFFLWGVTLSFLVLFWWSSSGGLFLVGDAASLYTAIGRLSALLAVYAVLMQFFLIGRVRWLERAFGFDALSRVHHWGGYAVVGFIASHLFFTTLGWAMRADVGFFSQFLQLIFLDDVFLALIAVVFFIGVALLSVAIVRKRLPYELWYVTHLLVYVAIVFAWGHQLELGGDFAGNIMFQLYWYALYILSLGSFVWYRFLVPFWLFIRHRFFVSRVVKENDQVVSIYISGKFMQLFQIQAGQFIVVRFLRKDLFWQAHPFSLSRSFDGKELRITVKNLGDFSGVLGTLVPGTSVFLEGPYGSFILPQDPGRKYLFIAGGIGITPICALTQEARARGDDVVLLYGVRTSRESVFHNEFKEAAPKMHIVCSEEMDAMGVKKRITLPFIRERVPDYTDREIYICGPQGMIVSLRKQFLKDGIDASRIHYELFEM